MLTTIWLQTDVTVRSASYAAPRAIAIGKKLYIWDICPGA